MAQNGITSRGTNGYRFQLELRDASDRVVQDVPLRDRVFEPAIRDAWFRGFRQGMLAEYRPSVDASRIEPLFADHDGNAPETVGFRITPVPLAEGDCGREFGMRYFRSLAGCIRSQLVRTEQISPETEVRYRVCAYLDSQQPSSASSPAIVLGPETQHLPLVGCNRADLGRTIAWDNPTAEDVPVLVPGWLLNEAVAEARDTPEREIAGVLAGHLCQDMATRSIFVSVTCLIAGEDTVQSTEGTVTLTPETWRLARELIHLRGAGEAIIGWYHSHPFQLCPECPLPAPAECVNKILFFSQDDVQLMETLFDQPYMIGLLVASETRLERSLGHLPLRLFGWRDGEVCARGLEVLYES